MEDFKKTPLWDSSLPIEKRLDYLLKEMTIEEKLGFLATRTPALARLGIGSQAIGGEAAHGVEARHDQDEIRVPEPTTSFPQPIGMSATWDTELIREAGEVTGREARALFLRHPDRGLCRWAPTVDMERDPRWGRTEEAYGEDPYLTGKMASAYVRGMQGGKEEHLLISAALKHFCANNVENGRGVKSSSLDARCRHDYYYEPFRRIIEEGGATSLMTAYNAVNGVVCMLDGRSNELIKDKWGLRGHIVCDGGAMSMVANDRKATASHAETIAKSLKAGVDCMTDIPEVVGKAAKEAYERGWITEEDIDRALRHSFTTKLRLGLYDARETNPWSHLTEAELDSAQNREISQRMADEAIVLLKNDGLLPLRKEENIALLGPLADVWYQDWYGGEPVYRTTVCDGVKKVTGREMAAADGLDVVYLRCGGDMYAALDEEGYFYITKERSRAEQFCIQEWGEGSVTFYAPRLERYLMVHDDGKIAADKKEIFGWFIKECFHWDGAHLQTWYHAGLCADADGRVTAQRTVYESTVGVPQTGELAEKDASGRNGGELLSFATEILENGIEKAVETAKQCDAAVLVLGCCPVINGKEDADRPSILFPPAQRALAKAVYEANPRTAMVLLCNYPYAVDWEQENLPAILWSATGSQDMGNAVARCLFGETAPAGRLNMTWYGEETLLPDMDDYDIHKTRRTYRFFEGQALYPFGHGLTYSPVVYSDFKVWEEKQEIRCSLRLTNCGDIISDEVVQIYAKLPQGRTWQALRRLVGFCRVKALAPKETREVSFAISRSELRYYDVACAGFVVAAGTYVLEAGASSADIRLHQEFELLGEAAQVRKKGCFVWADHWDDYENAVLDKAPQGSPAEGCSAAAKEMGQPARLVYCDCEGLASGCCLALTLAAPAGGSVEVWAGGCRIADWSGQTDGFQKIEVRCGEVPEEAQKRMDFVLTGDVRLAGFVICD